MPTDTKRRNRAPPAPQDGKFGVKDSKLSHKMSIKFPKKVDKQDDPECPAQGTVKWVVCH